MIARAHLAARDRRWPSCAALAETCEARDSPAARVLGATWRRLLVATHRDGVGPVEAAERALTPACRELLWRVATAIAARDTTCRPHCARAVTWRAGANA